jgi:IPT/TIG domain
MLLGAAAGCGVGAEPAVAVGQLSPAMAYSEIPLPAAIYGSGFRPAYEFDTGTGNATVDIDGFSAALVGPPPPTGGAPAKVALAAVSWQSVGLLAAQIPAGIPAGVYDLVVRDPRGQNIRLASAFTSLGVCTTPPAVAFTTPTDGAVVGAGAQLSVIVTADDGLGQLAGLQVSFTTAAGALPPRDCPLTGGATTACPFTLTVPAPSTDADMLTITAQGTGSGGLSAAAQVALKLVPAPVPAGLTPAVGSTLGGVLVTITGADIVPGATQVAFDGQPAYVYYATSTTIVVLTPAHAPGAAQVTLTTGGATAALTSPFKYVAPPIVREVSPTSGPAAGLIPIVVVGDNFSTSTEVTIGDSPLLCAKLVNANRIEGLVPPGAGDAPVAAYDQIAGAASGTPVSFQYLADAGVSSADGGCPGVAGP